MCACQGWLGSNKQSDSDRAAEALIKYGLSSWLAHFHAEMFNQEIPGAPEFFKGKVPTDSGLGWYLQYLKQEGLLGPGKEIDSYPLPMDQWGELSFRLAFLEAIAKGQIPCETTGAIGRDLWAMMLYNCALNPLGAVLDVPYGELARRDASRMIMKGIVHEVFEVMAAAGYRTHWQRPAEFLEAFYGRLVPDTAEHKSSTLQDISAGKRTEIEALNGAVIKLAERQGVDVPYNTAVYNIVKFLEQRGT